jgi:hypothetical protein
MAAAKEKEKKRREGRGGEGRGGEVCINSTNLTYIVMIIVPIRCPIPKWWRCLNHVNLNIFCYECDNDIVSHSCGEMLKLMLCQS